MPLLFRLTAKRGNTGHLSASIAESDQFPNPFSNKQPNSLAIHTQRYLLSKPKTVQQTRHIGLLKHRRGVLNLTSSMATTWLGLSAHPEASAAYGTHGHIGNNE
jgi:hypothetical protein